MFNKKVFIICLMVLCFLINVSRIHSQTLTPKVIASGGGYTTKGNVSLSYTIGETFISTVKDANKIVTQGFQYPVVSQVNQAPVIANQTLTINENLALASVAGIVAATDANAGQVLSFTIIAGNTGNAFIFSGNELRVAAPLMLDFEVTPSFILTVRVTDNGSPALSSSAVVTVNLTNLNDNPPVITSNGGGLSANISVVENSLAVTTVTATDADAATTITYSLSGGADSSRFIINPSTGVLAFKNPPDFEIPADAGANNVYDVIVRASDGTNNDEQIIVITITNFNDNPPVITSNGGGATAAVSVAENTTAVTTVAASDADPSSTINYSLNGGADSARFTINATTGVLAFITPPDFEIPTDAGANNVYDVVVKATDGVNIDVQSIAVNVTNVVETPANQPPVITTNGGGPTAAISLIENTLSVTTVTATDPDAGTTITYSLNGGADAARFSINPSTGALSFLAPPDFENPTDGSPFNSYVVIVRAGDGNGGTDDQTITVSVTNENEPPVIISNGGGATAAISVAENTTTVTTVVAADADALATVSYSLNGGKDSARFSINATSGVLRFIGAPDFEIPTDTGFNNVYDVVVRASDGTNTDNQAIAVTVTNLNDNPPVITSNGGGATAVVAVAENTIAVTTVAASDADAGTTITYSLNGGADAARFTINSTTGVLAFITAPDFEIPVDAGANNVYDVIVRATDGTDNDDQGIAVTITNVVETPPNQPPVITSNGGGNTAAVSISENLITATTITATDPDAGTTINYSLNGGTDVSKFNINSLTGVLTFKSAPDFENPTDVSPFNSYIVIVRASDGNGAFDDQVITINITNINEPPVITSNGGGINAAISVAENTAAVTSLVATDADADAVITYSISGGVDAGKFNINPSTGALTFITPPDFEVAADAGANNVYDLIVRAGDGLNNDEQVIAVTVTNLNDNLPIITSNSGGASATISVPENSVAVTTVIASDADTGTIITYSLNGGADALKFVINPSTGVLAFVSPPDFELPTDANANNVYDVIVRAGDGLNTDDQIIAVTVTNLAEAPNQPPVITSNGGGITATTAIAENTIAITTVIASDPDAGTTITYSINGGADAAKFNINSTTGALTFITAPDFENPTDISPFNSYIVVVRALDGNGGTDDQTLTVNINNVNEPPVITSNGGGSSGVVSVAENTVAVTIVFATDPDASSTITYSLNGGADAAKFSINAATGALVFNASPDFEVPADFNLNNIYEVTVRATDGTNTDDQALSVTVTNVNDNPPVITSNGGGATSSVSIAENTTAVTTVIANDADAATVIAYSLNGGADASKFTINSLTGVLAFINPPDFEIPTDAGANNIYDVIIKASDGTNIDEQILAVSVTNVIEAPVNQPPVITSNSGGTTAAFSLAENVTAVTTVTATDPDAGTTISYSLNGGADVLKFAINSATGVVTFVAAPDFENPTDGFPFNSYIVVVRASDGNGGFDDQTITVSITNVNESPVITSNGGGSGAAIAVAENSINVTTVLANDADAGSTITYSLNGGADASKFSINAISGLLTFINAPDFDLPSDAGTNNVYDVIVRASDGTNFDDQAIAVTVTNLNDNPPIITSNGGGLSANISVVENSLAVTTVTATDADAATTITYSLSGGADSSRFIINPSTGVLAFKNPPDFEIPADAGANNVYDVIVRASDGTNNDEQIIVITITNLNDNPPVITSNGGGATAAVSVAENTTAVTTVAASDADPSSTINYSLNGGADSARFTINATTGVLAFITPPDFEIPTDAGANNVYDVVVKATDGVNIDVQSIAVNVTNVVETPANQPPVITTNGGGPTAAISLIENTLSVTTVTATDPDAGTTITYSLNGGADAARFSINPSTGALSFLAPPDFENPTDGSPFNSYVVIVRAGDGNGGTDDQTITVSVTNENEPPVIISNGGGATAAISVAENTTTVTTVVATDADALATVTYSLNGGKDFAKFSINATSGILRFIGAPDFEIPTDTGFNNVYDVVVQASDGTNTDNQAIAVTVTNLNDNPPVITSNGGGATAAVAVAENTIAVTTVAASDADAGTTITYSLNGGADAARFTINSTTGVLDFITAPNFEIPADAGANNVYDVIIRAADGTNNDDQAIAVTVTNQNDNPPVISSNGGGNSAAVLVAENTTSVTAVSATDADAGSTFTFTLNGGADALKFSINASSGILNFIAAPDFEIPSDAGANNVYDVIVRVSDGLFTDDQAIAVTVTNVVETPVNQPPVITSGGGGATAVLSIPENTTAATSVTATDADAGTTLTFSLNGGADAGKFVINATTGALAFVNPPDFETPTDAAPFNSYIVIVRVSDGNGGTDDQTITVNVTNVNESPVITSIGGGNSGSVSIAENTTSVVTVVANDLDAGSSISYTVNGGADAARFSINALTGALVFINPPDFEIPTDAGNNNVYDVIVGATDGTDSDEQAIAVTVTNVVESAELSITFSGKIFLQGAYNTTSGLMSNTLNTSGILQANAVGQPYTASGFNYTGNEMVGANFYASNRDVVDWVLIELRNASNPSIKVAVRAAFVKRDGSLVETEGSNAQVSFQNVSAGSYYVSIRHRNHLGMRSAGLVDFSSGAATYDFTTAANKCFQNQTYTSTIQMGTVWAMRGGNANANGNIKYNGPQNDQDRIQNTKLGGSLSLILTNQYAPEDINMDGVIKTNGPLNDQNFLLNAIFNGFLSNIYMEQL